MYNQKLQKDLLEKKQELNQLELFKYFLQTFPEDVSKEELLKENFKLLLTDFTNLINKYY